MTLRTRLVALALLLVVLISAIIGVVSVVTLNRSLSERLDQQLDSAFARGADVVTERGPTARFWPETGSGRDAHAILNGPAQAPGTLAVVVAGGALTGGYLGEDGTVLPVEAAHLEALAALPADGLPHTLGLGDELGEYRVQGAMIAGSIVIVGLPLDDLRKTVTGLAWWVAGVALVGVIVLATIGTVLIRRELRPLERVATLADGIAAQHLDRGSVERLERLDVQGLDADSEVGRVLRAVNGMLENVERALSARETSEQQVRTFVADASHELRTPLASIRGYSELVRRIGGELPEDVVRSLGRIESESLRMQALVEDLLLLARLDEGRSQATGTVDFAPIVRAALGDAAVVDPERTWELDVPEGPVPVLADPGQLHQIVANLLGNARQHTDPGTRVLARLRILPGGTTAGSSVAELTVRDTGAGIPENVIDRVFSRFVRGDASRARAEHSSGSGLGLSIVAAIVEAAGGSVAVASKPGDTRFTVLLPLAGEVSPAVS